MHAGPQTFWNGSPRSHFLSMWTSRLASCCVLDIGGEVRGRILEGRGGEWYGWGGEGKDIGGERRGGEGRGGEGANFTGGILMRELASIQYIHKPSHNVALALETLVLQIQNSEQVKIINSVLWCVLMYCLSGGWHDFMWWQLWTECIWHGLGAY